MAEDLPYDMGNSGDMLKHGFLAEFVRSGITVLLILSSF